MFEPDYHPEIKILSSCFNVFTYPGESIFLLSSADLGSLAEACLHRAIQPCYTPPGPHILYTLDPYGASASSSQI